MKSCLVDSPVILEALKGNPREKDTFKFLMENFVEVPLAEEISDMAFELMTKHALLPNFLVGGEADG
ncbi:PIN domain-containing protein [Thermococcus zilligii]|uniref:hypothetical protein n=1 Tax=Thermococcus zilligii TaxID=54076 RepID=UPI00029ADC13|nr:hypothetical protein [Thermococcus zilligii]